MNNTVAPAASTAAIANKQQPNMALDGSEVSKGPDQSIGSASNSVTQPIGIDYNIFQGSADGATAFAAGGGVSAQAADVAGSPEDIKRKQQEALAQTSGSMQSPQSGGNPNDYIGQWAYDLSQGNIEGMLKGPGMRALERGDIMSAVSPVAMIVKGLADGGLVQANPQFQANQQMAQNLASQGTNQDSMLVHMSPREVQGLGSLHPSGQMPVNPRTGLPEADFLTDVLPGIAGTLVGSVVGMPWLGAAVGGLGTWAATGNLGKGILSGLMSFGLGSIGGALGEAGAKTAGEAATKGASDVVAEAAKSAAQTSGGAAAGINPATFADPMAQGAAQSVGVQAGAGGAAVPAQGMFGKIAQGFSNPGQAFQNIGTGIMNPQNVDFSKMIMPGVMAASGGMGLYNANQPPAAIPNPMAQQQQSQYSGTPSATPFRTPTGGVVPQGQSPAGYQGELSYFAPNPAYRVYAAEGGLMGGGAEYELAKGGLSELPSGLIRGPGAGMDDKVKGSIDGRRDVYLSDGEYVVDAQTISALGDGSTEAGAKRMKGLVEEIRQKKFGSKKQPPKMAETGGLASLHLQEGSDGKAVQGGTYRGPGFLERYFGIGADEPQDPSRSWSMPPPKSEWPTQEDVDAARSYKLKYGNINEQEINPPAEDEDVKYRQRGTKLNFMPVENLREFERTGKAKGVQKKESKEFSDALYAAQLAANMDPVSYLGKDVNKLNINDPPGNYTNAGYHSPSTDQIWWSGGKKQRTTPMHEYTHRGISQLLKEHPDILKYNKKSFIDERADPYWDEEEYLLRRMILERFGPIELGSGRKIEDHPDPAYRAAFKKDENADSHINEIRRKAGDLVARRLIENQGAVR